MEPINAALSRELSKITGLKSFTQRGRQVLGMTDPQEWVVWGRTGYSSPLSPSW